MAVHVLVIVLGQPPIAIEDISENTTSTFPSQLSDALTNGLLGTGALQVKVISNGTPTKTGIELSVIVIVCDLLDELPQSSVAVHVLIKL